MLQVFFFVEKDHTLQFDWKFYVLGQQGVMEFLCVIKVQGNWKFYLSHCHLKISTYDHLHNFTSFCFCFFVCFFFQHNYTRVRKSTRVGNRLEDSWLMDSWLMLIKKIIQTNIICIFPISFLPLSIRPSLALL